MENPNAFSGFNWDDFFNRTNAALDIVKKESDNYFAKANAQGKGIDMLPNVFAGKNNYNDTVKLQNFYSGNAQSGANPYENFRINEVENLKNIVNYGKAADSWAYDSFKFAKPLDFNGTSYGQFFDRYYMHPKYNKLGFSPYRDNEVIYNKNSTWKDDFVRMTKVWGSLAWDGYTGLFNNWGNFSLRGDIESAEKMERLMGIATSTKEGTGAFVTNLAGNTAYTFGIMGEILTEELALLALSRIPGFQGLAASRTAKNLERGVDVIKNFGNFTQQITKLKDLVKSIKGVDAARAFRTGSVKFGKGALNFLNPFEYTSDFIRNFDKIDDAAKLSRGFGAFYRDMRSINAVLDESTLEAGFVQNSVNKDLLDKYYDQYGKLPEAGSEDAKKIAAHAERAGVLTSQLNVPAILYSNKVVLNKLVRPTSMILDDIGRKLGYGFSKSLKDGKVVYQVFDKAKFNVIKNTDYWKSLPKAMLRGSYGYMSANITEGFQELYQEGVAAGVEDYYKKTYDNETMGGLYKLKAIFLKGAEEMNSELGLDVFLSGALMGGPVNLVQGALFKGLNLGKDYIYNNEKLFGADAATRKKQAQQLKEFKAEEAQKIADALTLAADNPNAYFKLLDEDVVQQKNLSQLINKALLSNDKYELHNYTHESVALYLSKLVEHGLTGELKKQLRDFEKLSDSELEELVNKDITNGEKGPEIRNKIRKSIDRISGFERRAEQFDNIFGQNPYSDPIESAAFRKARQMVIYNYSALDNTLERLEAIYNKVGAAKIPGIDQMDLTIFLRDISFTTGISLSGIAPEYNLLKQEYEILKQGSPEDKVKAEKLKQKIDVLTKLQKSIEEFETNRIVLNKTAGSNEVTEEQLNQAKELDATLELKAKENFREYIKEIANQNNKGNQLLDTTIDDIFQDIIDYRKIVTDKESLINSINLLSNPDYFNALKNKIKAVKEEVFKNRNKYIKSSLEKYMEMQLDNQLVNDLFSARVFVAEDGWEQIANGLMPRLYYVPKEAGELGNRNVNIEFEEVNPLSANPAVVAAYSKAMEIIRDYENEKGITLQGKKLYRASTETIKNEAGEVMRSENDTRSLQDLMEEVGMDPKTVRHEVTAEEFATILAQSEYLDYPTFELLRSLAVFFKDKNYKVIFTKQGQPVVYNNNGDISIDLEFFAADYDSTMNYERSMAKALMKQVGAYALKNKPEFAKDINTLLDTVNKWIAEPENKAALLEKGIPANAYQHFGLSSADAFVAEAMTNPVFQGLLNMVKAEKKGKPTVFKTFLEAVKMMMQEFFKFAGVDTILDAAVQVITENVFDSSKIKVYPEIKTTTAEAVTESVKTKDLQERFPDLYDNLEKIMKDVDSSLSDIYDYMSNNPDDEEIQNAINSYIEKLNVIRITLETKAISSLTDPQLNQNLMKLGYTRKDAQEMDKSDKIHILENKVVKGELENKYQASYDKLKSEFGYSDEDLQGMSMSDVIDLYNQEFNDYANNVTEFTINEKQKEAYDTLMGMFPPVKFGRFPVNVNGEIIKEDTEDKVVFQQRSFMLDQNGEPIEDPYVRSSEIHTVALGKEQSSVTSPDAVRGTYIDDIFREFMKFNSPIRSQNEFIDFAENLIAEKRKDTNPEFELYRELEFTKNFYVSLFNEFARLRKIAVDNGILLITDMPRMFGVSGGYNVTGQADVFAVYPDGSIEIWDLKTATRSRRSDYGLAEKNQNYKPKDSIQLNSYAELIENNGLKISGVRILPVLVPKRGNTYDSAKIEADPALDKQPDTIKKLTIKVDRTPVEDLVNKFKGKLKIEEPTAVSEVPDVVKARFELEKKGIDTTNLTSEQVLEQYMKLISPAPVSVSEKKPVPPVIVPKQKTVKISSLVNQIVLYYSKPYVVKQEGIRYILESSDRIIEVEDEFIEDLNIELPVVKKDILNKKYKITSINESNVTVNNVEYIIRVDNKGNVIGLSPLNNPDQVIKNESIIVAVEIERNKLEYNSIELENIVEDEKVYDEVKNKYPALRRLEVIYGENFTETVDIALEKLYNNEALTDSERLQLDLWVTDAINNVSIDYVKTNDPILSNALDNLEIINILLYTQNQAYYEKVLEKISAAERTERKGKERIKSVKTQRERKLKVTGTQLEFDFTEAEPPVAEVKPKEVGNYADITKKLNAEFKEALATNLDAASAAKERLEEVRRAEREEQMAISKGFIVFKSDQEKAIEKKVAEMGFYIYPTYSSNSQNQLTLFPGAPSLSIGDVLDIRIGEQKDFLIDGYSVVDGFPLEVYFGDQQVSFITIGPESGKDNYNYINTALYRGADVKLIVSNIKTDGDKVISIEYKIIRKSDQTLEDNALFNNLLDKVNRATFKTQLSSDIVNDDYLIFSTFGEFLDNLKQDNKITEEQYKMLTDIIESKPDRTVSQEVVREGVPEITNEDQSEIVENKPQDGLEIPNDNGQDLLKKINEIQQRKCK